MKKKEDNIDCCEWCGRDTHKHGRFVIEDGPGIKLVLCVVCTHRYYGDPQHLQPPSYINLEIPVRV